MNSEDSANIYVNTLHRFLEWKKTTPEETLQWTPERAAREMISYIQTLKGKGKTSKYAGKYLATTWYALKSWFADNGVCKIKVDEKVPIKQQVKFLDKIPTKEELKRILDCSSMQTKAMDSTMAFGGMRPKDASELTYSSIKEDFEARVTPMAIYHLVSKAGGLWHVAFLTSQGVGYLREWIDYRKARGERFKDSTPLFINLKSKKREQIGVRGFEQAIVEAMRRAGWKKKDKRFRYRPYGLRKYFRANLSNIDPDFREYLVAHKSGVNSLVAIYDGLRDLHKPTIDKLREQFKKAEPSLNTDIAPGSIVGEAKNEAIKSMVKNVFGVDLMEVKIAKEKELGRELASDEKTVLFENEMKKLRENPDPQKIIGEDELEAYLAEGWQFVSVLPSRKILIRTEGTVPIKPS
ncbi:hypothetical protein ES703_00821 [subsurface metagenome]